MRKVLLSFSTIFILLTSFAQSFSINTDGSIADTSAILDVKSTEKGMLIPRMQKAARTTIYQPAAGLLVYQAGPDSTGFYFYDGSKWLWLISTATIQGADTLSWKRTGNAGTNPSVNFIGTIDNQPLTFRVNNVNAGAINHLRSSTSLGVYSLAVSTGFTNVAIGDSAMKNNSSASGLTAIGYAAMKNNTTGLYNTATGSESAMQNLVGTHNTSNGYLALRNNTASFNTSVGAFSMYTNTIGNRNTAIGCSALYFTNASDNVAVGYEALNQSFSGSRNVAIGSNALRQHSSGSLNVAIGDSAAYNLVGAFTGNAVVGSGAMIRGAGSYNTIVGQNAAINNNASWTTIIGVSAGQNNRAGGSVFVGSSAGANNTFGSNNTFLGDNAGAMNKTGINNTYAGSFTGYTNKGNGNTMVGAAAGTGNDSSNYNTFIGAYAGWQTSIGSYNTITGAYAGLSNSTGSENIFLGSYAGAGNSSGSKNFFGGYYAGYSNFSGRRNIGIGNRALYESAEDSMNIAIGDSSGYYNRASENVFIGSLAGKNNMLGTPNVFIGTKAGYMNTGGSLNTFTGYRSGIQNNTGQNNTFVGAQTGIMNTTGSNNTLLGYNTDVITTDLVYATAIGSGARAGISDAVCIGDTTRNTTVGIGTAYPSKAGLVVNTTVGGQVHAMFGSNTTGISLESNWPGIGFNSYYNAGRRYISNGYSGHLNLDMTNGSFYILIHGNGTANNLAPYDKGVAFIDGSGSSGAFIPYFGNVYNLGTLANRWLAVYATNGTIQTSDAREKKNIAPLGYGLRQVMQLKPVSYQWKNKQAGEQVMLGLLAQDVQKIIPEVITESDGIYGMRTAALIPVLIKAVQEQQAIILALQQQAADSKTIALAQAARIEQQQQLLNEVMKRLDRLEQK